MEKHYLTSQSFYWTVELVGTSQRLFFNLVLFVISGVVGVRFTDHSVVVIFILGGLLPAILNYCLYKLLWETIKSDKFQILRAKISKTRMKFMLVFDIAIVLGFALAVGTGLLSNQIFKVVACTIIPAIQVISLRGMLILYLS